VIGQTLGGRYEILERVGGGGMALVYKGQDLLLNRKVAVKILRQQYVHDEEFIRRFRREAQSAASLSHPNVVSIYDVGQEDEIHYIVMEYIEGTTLNELIKERSPMQVEEAINIASQICDALDHAHHNGIIHRDIKPHNILIGRNGRVKVTDFGIARAATSSSITQTGSVIGSVHYFSPEHAKGSQAGEMSDLYSLGIVLYQMLTAKLPFSGESPISVALKHLQENVEAPRSVNPLIPQSVENLILKSMRKRPEERYQKASDMMKDLETCLLPERRNEAKLELWEPEFPEDMDDESTRVIPTIRSRQYTNPMVPKNESYSRPTYTDNEEDDDDYEYEYEEPPKKKAWLKPTIWIVVLLAILGGMLGLYKTMEKMFVVENVKMPNLVGIKQTEAEYKLRELKLTAKIVEETSDKEVQEVLKTYPEPDMDVKVNSEVILYVSKGPDLPRMPSFKGSNYKDALAKLTAMGVDTDTQVIPNYVYAEDTPSDIVRDQEPGVDQPFDPKTTQIKLTVSQGKETVKVPDLLNMTINQAKSALGKNDLVLDDKVTTEKSNTIAKGKIMQQFPYDPGMEAARGTKISVIVSDGPDEVLKTQISVPLKPSVEGQKSEFKVLLTDDTSTNKQVFKKKLDTEETIDVPVIVSPNKSVTITVYENDIEVNAITRRYEDLKQ